MADAELVKEIVDEYLDEMELEEFAEDTAEYVLDLANKYTDLHERLQKLEAQYEHGKVQVQQGQNRTSHKDRADNKNSNT